MRNRVWVGVLAGLLTLSAAAQTAKDAEKALRESLVKKQVFPRGHSADAVIHWKWSGKELVADEPKFFTLGVLTVKSVKLNGDHVMIQGDRQIIVKTQEKMVQLSSETEPVTIDVDLTGANAAEVLPQLPGLLFYSDMQQEIRQIPEAYIGLIPTGPVPKAGAAAATTACDCSHAAACSEYVAYTTMVGVKPPTMKVATPLPVASPDSPSISVVGLVDDTGHLKQVWLGRPLNPVADETILSVAKAYNFVPATCHDKPVSAAIRVDVPMGPADRAGGQGRR